MGVLGRRLLVWVVCEGVCGQEILLEELQCVEDLGGDDAFFSGGGVSVV